MIDVSGEGQVFGLKIAFMIAGFLGALVSLSFLHGLTRLQVFTSLVVGIATANYVAPVAIYWLKIPPQIELGTAFLMGLLAMNIIPALLKISETNNIVAFLRARLGMKGDVEK